MPVEPDPIPTFSERLTVPLRWWFVVFLFVVSVFVAVAFYLLVFNGLIAALATAAIVAGVLVPYGAIRITVDDQALTIGPNRIEWTWVGGVVPLEAEEARHRLGPGADAKAHLVVRPYIAQAVEITIADPADPHPYWLVSSRHAPALAAAIAAHLPKSTTTTHTAEAVGDA